MVQISLSASVSVAGGPVLPVGLTLAPDSYVVSDAVLAPQGQAGDTAEIPLVPDDVALTLLAVAATEAATGKGASVTVVPAHDTTDGDPVAVDGTFVLANADVLGRLVTDGPQVFKVTNEGTVAASVRLLAAFEEV
ncbi:MULTISPECIES: hypothetical protein [unclassified Isoptericola]|uniref:hypothetical protein n=1 Tax=unclassified Isoptericola TaxID=2623355 RepID=UPI00365205FE